MDSVVAGRKENDMAIARRKFCKRKKKEDNFVNGEKP
jgi:hypothetical protein